MQIPNLFFADVNADAALPIKGFFKIIKPPDGEAPENVRKAWVGMILPFTKICEGGSTGIITGKQRNCGKEILVPQVIAILALESHCPEAADWWKKSGRPNPLKGKDNTFGFLLEEVEVLNFEDLEMHYPDQLKKLNKIMNTPPYSIIPFPTEGVTPEISDN